MPLHSHCKQAEEGFRVWQQQGLGAANSPGALNLLPSAPPPGPGPRACPARPAAWTWAPGLNPKLDLGPGPAPPCRLGLGPGPAPPAAGTAAVTPRAGPLGTYQLLRALRPKPQPASPGLPPPEQPFLALRRAQGCNIGSHENWIKAPHPDQLPQNGVIIPYNSHQPTSQVLMCSRRAAGHCCPVPLQGAGKPTAVETHARLSTQRR